MFTTVFLFELAYWFKRPLTLLFFALFFLMAFFSTASDAFLGVAGGQIHRNAPFVLASGIGILTAIGQVITTAIAGTAVLRDAQLGTEEMLFTTQLTKSGYLLGRFAGAFVIEEPVFKAYARNITPDKETGIGSWTDDQIINTIRNGQKRDGTFYGPPM